MSDPQRFSCFLIGADTLLAECGEIILREGHEIRGVITAEPRIARWASSKNLRVLDPKSFRTALIERPFDFLFAITHLAILPDDVISLPKRWAINFHDGPLPRYAGLNTPAWALIHGETEYGITFHVMTPGVDEGDILAQRMFEISPKETSLSLNTKCFATAIEVFSELVPKLAADAVIPAPQPKSGRTYFGKHDKPKAAGVLDFRRPATELEALVRALDFGPYPNPLGSAKVSFSGHTFVVQSAEARNTDAGAVSPANGSADALTISGAPGTVLAVKDDEILVATGEGALALTALRSQCGRDQMISEVVARGNIAPGRTFDALADDDRERLTALGPELSRAETGLAKQFSALEPIEIPYARVDIPAGDARFHQLALEVPAAFRTAFSSSLEAATVSAFSAFLGRIGGKERFHLAFCDEALRSEMGSLYDFVSTDLPFEVSLDESLTFDLAIVKTNEDLARCRKRRGYLRDIVGRHPELSHRPEIVSGFFVPVALLVDRAAKGHDVFPAPGTVLALQLVGSHPGEQAGTCSFVWDERFLAADAVAVLKRHFESFLRHLAANPTARTATIDVLDEADHRKIVFEWNQTEAPYRKDATIHRLIEEQVDRTPRATAVVFEGQSISYRDLDERANKLAHHLAELGVNRQHPLVGIHVERSIDLIVAVLATWKAGGAYVPLDPVYPKDRIAFMIEDAKVRILIVQSELAESLPAHAARLVRIDTDWRDISRLPASPPNIQVEPSDLAYVIFTSGSTGKPKGVQIEHHNVSNFFSGMDPVIEHDPPGTWLAVTSLSFDISVLELFYTLARGFKVVVYRDQNKELKLVQRTSNSERPMAFGLFMWGNDEAEGSKKYELMVEGAKYFDRNGFDSVWTPERHFHAFGGPYPNPAVTGAAVAAVTSRLRIMAGSCVSPLHHPIRIAEEWAVVDNLSDGRVGLSFASGWQVNDFILRPESHANYKAVMLEQIETVRRLWRGEAVEFTNPKGERVELRTLPRPVQKELPFWVTTAGNPETYRIAGRIGANVLTHLLGQSLDEVAGKIEIYRKARAEAGFDASTGVVTLMLHTFVGDSKDEVRRVVRQPLKDYLESSLNLLKNFAWDFPAFKRPDGADPSSFDVDLHSLSIEEKEAILDFAFDRYFETSGLFGTPESCLEMVDRCKAIGVDEIACLLDFGVPTSTILKSLPNLKELRERSNQKPSPAEGLDLSIAGQIRGHGATHLQCTPSMARMLLMNEDARAALGTVQHLMVGGEAFPIELAKDLLDVVPGTITNMYGPTETTIWSSTHRLNRGEANIPIGRPIANTQLYVLDRHKKPVPPGVPGELYIAGDGVVRGYLDRDELNRERFLPDPFRGGSARMYRTGDLARFRNDGVLEFLGRTDHQVKIRGYRIELGEIEAMLSRHASVRECVVILREDQVGDQRLVAYVVPDGPSPEEGELKEYLRAKLPEYMVPAHFPVLDALPLTPNGKIDRKALPRLDAFTPSVSKSEFVAPESEIELQVAKVWQEALGRESVGLDDNFFDIGGHSLLVVRVHRQLKDVIPKSISLTDLYRFPTIRSLTAHLGSDGVDESLQDSQDRGQRRKELMNRRRRRGRTEAEG